MKNRDFGPFLDTVIGVGHFNHLNLNDSRQDMDILNRLRELYPMLGLNNHQDIPQKTSFQIRSLTIRMLLKIHSKSIDFHKIQMCSLQFPQPTGGADEHGIWDSQLPEILGFTRFITRFIY